MLNKKIVLPVMLGLVVSVTACTPGADSPKVEDNKPPIVDQSTDKDSNDDKNSDVSYDNFLSPYENIKLTPVDAFDEYMKKYPNTKVKKVQLDEDHGAYVYKVEGYDNEKEYELVLDPLNGDIVKEEEDMDDDDNGEITKSDVEKVQGLVDEALKEAGENSKIEEWTLKVNDGKAILEVEIDREGLDDIEYHYDIETRNLMNRNE